MAALLTDYLEQIRDGQGTLTSDSIVKLNIQRMFQLLFNKSKSKEIDELTIAEREAIVGVLLEQLKPLLNVEELF